MKPSDLIVICKPQPNGSAEPPQYFFYRGSLKGLTPASVDVLPKYEAIDDSPSANRYVLPYEHGWLLEFRRLGKGLQRWAVFAQDGKLFLDDGERRLDLAPTALPVQVRRWFFFSRVQVNETAMSRPERFWIYTPVSRLLLSDPAGEPDECEPLVEVFGQLATAQGYEQWLQRWSSGLAHRSTGLKVLGAAA